MAVVRRTAFLAALATGVFASAVVAQQSEVRPPEIVRPAGGDGGTVTILRGSGPPAPPIGAVAGPTAPAGPAPTQTAPAGGGTQTTVTTGPGAQPPIVVYDGSGRAPVVRQGRPPGVDGSYPQTPPLRRVGDGSPVGPSQAPAPVYGSGGLVPPLVGNQPAPAQPRPVCRAGYRIDGTCRDNP